MNREIKQMYKITLSKDELAVLIMDNANIPEDLHPMINNAILVGLDMYDDGKVVLRLEIEDRENS